MGIISWVLSLPRRRWGRHDQLFASQALKITIEMDRVAANKSSFVSRGIWRQSSRGRRSEESCLLHVFPRIASLYASFDEFQSV